MAAIVLDSTPARAHRFWVGMAACCVLIAFGGFAPTYWLQLLPGTFVGPPLLHIHGLLFSCWTLLLLAQTLLVANRRVDVHRALGLLGISLATAMVLVGLMAAIHTLTNGLAHGYGDRSRAFFVIPVSAIALFAGFFAAAIAHIRTPETHKRLMMLATVALLQAAVARVFFALIAGAGPGQRPGLGEPPALVFAIGPGLLVELLLVAGMVYDWRTRGRPHRVWIAGGLIMTVVVLGRGFIAVTPAWLAFADAMVHVAG